MNEVFDEQKFHLTVHIRMNFLTEQEREQFRLQHKLERDKRVCARGWGYGRLSGWQTDSKSSIFLGRGVLQLPL